MSGPIPSFHPSPAKPKLRLPKGACDTHVHVFGPSSVFPHAEDAPFVPADAPKEKLFGMHAHIGVERCCIVQSTCHGSGAKIEDVIALGARLAPLTLAYCSISSGVLGAAMAAAWMRLRMACRVPAEA